MMTELLYQTNSYIKDFTSWITSTNEDEMYVILEKTVFYPGGGGQPCDYGTLTADGKTYNVNRVKSSGGEVRHYLEGEVPAVGVEAACEIDWDRRYKLMRTHSALHVLCGVIWRDYSASVTGCNMEPLKARMDFEFKTMHGELVREIEFKVNTEIQNNREISIKILPREEAFKIPDLIRTKINLLPDFIKEVRIVEIVGLDLQADGGTHLKNTSEIGKVKVLDYKSKGRINKRIWIEVE